MNQTEIKSGLALVASQSSVIRAWASFGMIHASTENGLFTFSSLKDIRNWVSL